MSEVRQRWLTVTEAAAVLGMSKQTLWRRIREGVIELPRIDGRLVVPASRLPQLAASPALNPRPYNRRQQVRG